MKTIRKFTPVLAIALIAFAFQGCGTTEVAKAQQTVHITADILEDFVHFEKANREALFRINPEIKHFTDQKLRFRSCPTCKPNAQKYAETAIAMIDAYKDHRDPEHRANMDTAIAVIQELINQISNYFLDAQVANLDQATALKYRNAKVVP